MYIECIWILIYDKFLQAMKIDPSCLMLHHNLARATWK
jgi:hypothetical protein